MPTRYYLHNRPAPYTPATIRGAWNQTAGAIAAALDAVKWCGEAPGGGNFSTVNVGTEVPISLAETSTTNDFDVLLGRWISGPLAAQTISGTLNVCIAVSENNALRNLHWHLHVYVTQGNSDTPRGVILADYTEAAGINEWPVGTGFDAHAFIALNAAAALTNLAVSAGDRIVVEAGFVSHDTSASSARGCIAYGTMTVDGGIMPDGVVGDSGALIFHKASYIDFSVNLTENTNAVAVRLSQLPIEVLTGDAAGAVRIAHIVRETIVSSLPVTDYDIGPIAWVEWPRSIP